MSPSASHKVVYVALGGNLLIAVVKFMAAAYSGSSAMLSEGVHSLVDTTNELLLLYGLRRAAMPPDPLHPFGHGRELYFWSFIVALLVLAIGAGLSSYEGVVHIARNKTIDHSGANYIVLLVSMLFEGSSWRVALGEFRARKGKLGYFEAFRLSKDPTTFTVLLEDSAALVGLLIALVGLAGAQLLKSPVFDGIASVGIGCVLAVSALLLARETKGLLIGETAHPAVSDAIMAIAAADADVRIANGVLTVQMGPHQVVAALSAEFEDVLSTTQIEACVHRIEKRAKVARPEIISLFIKPQTAKVWRDRRRAIEANAHELEN
ncbi:cation diffusion facilitator family transporter [Rhodanobacter hydrolyticus]|uniref:Cation diffusion facilitator family transporter n=1 Tax=Rhodanobacter hydrolyticus TaxID=2250595 RepID=A0ABW8JBN8_9GAMM